MKGQELCPDPKTIWDVMAGVGSLMAGMATFVVAWVAWRQIGELKSQQKGWETLKACERYELDPVLNAALERLSRARKSGDLSVNPGEYEYAFSTILNYLEGLATGIRLGFYDDNIVREHLRDVMLFHWTEVNKTENQPPPRANDDPLRKKQTPDEDFAKLGELLTRWARRPSTYSFMRKPE